MALWFGHRAWLHLREVREEQGLTRQEAADLIHDTASMISLIEEGELTLADLDIITAYIEALGGTLEMNAVFGDRTLNLFK